MANFANFQKTVACGQTVLPERSILIRQNFIEKAKIKKFKCDNFGEFITLFWYFWYFS